MNVLILLCKVLNSMDNCVCCIISTFILCMRHQFLLNRLLLRILRTLSGLGCHYPFMQVIINYWVWRVIHWLLLTQIMMMLWHLESIESLASKCTQSCILVRGAPLGWRLVFSLFEYRLKQLILLLLRVVLIVIVILVVSAECNLRLGPLHHLVRVLPIIQLLLPRVSVVVLGR
jgi:hypothetical protein